MVGITRCVSYCYSLTSACGAPPPTDCETSSIFCSVEPACMSKFEFGTAFEPQTIDANVIDSLLAILFPKTRRTGVDIGDTHFAMNDGSACCMGDRTHCRHSACGSSGDWSLCCPRCSALPPLPLHL
ncbi:hypothetical protein B0H12DRAFT_706886 [Mycena haematopus]|nr:hypothetical protein B0H12DRAFT_706886 [Mycena haematopus]